MAGQPRKRAMILDLERRTREHFEDNEHTTLDYVEAWIEDGGTLVKLAVQIGESVAECKDLSADQITRYLRNTYGESTVQPRIELARKRGAHMIVERRMLTTEQTTNKDAVPAVKLQNDMATWLAGRWNRSELGEQRQGVSVQVNVAQLHISAMRQREIVLLPAEDAIVIESSESEIE